MSKIYTQRAGDGTWHLLVDGRIVVRQESRAVVDGVMAELEGRGSGVGELTEVAENIRRGRPRLQTEG